MTEVDESVDKWSMSGRVVGGWMGRRSVNLIKTKLISRKVPVWRFEYKFTYLKWLVVVVVFFYQGFLSQTLTTHRTQDSTGRERKKRTIFYSIPPLPTAHEHWDIHLQLCMWDDYHIFWIASLVFTRLLLDGVCHLIELPFDIWLIDDVTLSFCLFTWWFHSSFFVTAIWDGKPVDSNSYRLSALYYKRTD